MTRPQEGAARSATLVAVLATVAMILTPLYNPGGGVVRFALASGLVVAILAAHAARPRSLGVKLARHANRCSRCRNFAGDCRRMARIEGDLRAERGGWPT